MMARTLHLVLAWCLLGGCVSLNPNLAGHQDLLAARAKSMVAAYNAAHGTHYPVPQLSLDYPAAPASTVAAADYSHWTIRINPLWVNQDMCLVYKEALAHELAHLFVYYDLYGSPRVAMVPTAHGEIEVPMNGPSLLQDPDDEHGSAWQLKARALGADPCKEGYCYDAHPYRDYPLRCPGLGSKLASIEAYPAMH